MKEQEFDEIGKRLRDLEASPPQDGWKRIGGTLKEVRPRGRFSRHWWKPLLLIVPAFFYLGYNEFYGTVAVEEVNGLEIATGSGTGVVKSSGNERQNAEATDPRTTGNTHIPKAGSSISAEPDNESTTGEPQPVQNIGDGKRLNPDASASHEVSSWHNDEGLAPVSHSTVGSENHDAANSGLITTTAENSNGSEASLNAGTAGMVALQKPDTTIYTPLSPAPLPDSIIIKNAVEDTQGSSDAIWKVSFSLMPQYVNRTIRPFTSDEVLVTQATEGNSQTRRGLEAGLGIARALSEHWYLDARIAYNNLNHEIKHSFADGTVDTLIRVKQQDESVRVIPVYHVTDREIKSNYHYASLSIGTTYYFWANAKRRFNLSMSADMHYLLSAQIKEKVKDQWVDVSDNISNKTNYGFTVGAGYNLILSKGLELMIQPSLRYFIRDIKSAELPYELNQRSVGINFMLSKTIGKE